ncbi:MAG TPA: hypothetical protein VN158_10565, partial [Caulobacter sp.]|nr:hypothetical protein [Caulobacter sp.]
MKVAWLLAAGLCAAAGLTTQVQAQTPAAKLISAPLVAPSGIWSGSATHTRTAQAFTGPAPEVAILAKSLGAGRYSDDAYAKNVYDYIRNNIDIEFRFGLGKGGRGALIDQSGTAFDQAELMVELLRAGGVAASYQAGTITVDGVQFARWTGLSRGGAPGAAVDARSACQFLADGGIPASFAGATTCDGLNGDLSSVSMAHVWVSSGGKLYDPAFKQHALFGGIDLNTATSCAASASPRCGAVAASAAMTGAETGVYKGVSYIRTVNEAALGAQMDAFAQATQHAIEGADRFAEVEQVIGGKRVDITYAPTPGAALTVPFQVAATWNGDIPDVYRTTMRIRLGAVDRTFYADEIAGRRLRMTSDTAFLVDDVLAAGSSCSTCVANAALLDVNHPYPANGGAYADEALQFRMVEGEGSAFWTGSYPVSFVHAWGATSAASGQHLAAAQDRDPSGQRYNAAEWSCGGVQPYTYAMILSSCRNDAQPVLANKLLGQGAAADKIVAGVNKAAITRHHDLGIVYARPEAASAISFMSVQSAVSVISSEANASKRLAAFEVAAATWAMLEGSVSQQSDDSDRPLSTAGMFEAFNRQGRRFLNVPSASMASVLSSTTYFPTATPGHPTAEALGKARLQEAANAGYATLWPESGNAEVFFKADAVGYTLLESVKGGAPTNANPVKNILDTLKESDEGAARRKYLSVSPATGELTLKPAPDLVTGRDGFPQSLPFQRTYSSGAAVVERTVSSESSSDGGNNTNTSVSWSYRGPDSSVYSHLGAGWTHNYNVAATYSNDGAKALGSDGALNASGA